MASGDPLADGVILWTRVSPEIGRLGEPVAVEWWIARAGPGDAQTDASGDARRSGSGAAPVASGRAEASADRDYTVKIDVRGLEPGTEYVYGFASRGGTSRVGRTRTLREGDVGSLRLAVTSCSNYPEGYFNAYAAIARRNDFDVVLHLGDYLYEYGEGEYGEGARLGRIPDPIHETLTLADYRRRHATYKGDPDLQDAHARHPWITIWDDHEIANNAARDRAQNHDPNGKEGSWTERRLAAVRAYHEWMPIRELPTGLFRTFRFGDLAELIMLDTRLVGRDAQVARDDHEGARDPGRTLLGEAQESLLLEALSMAEERGTPWKVVGQQVVVSPLTDGVDAFNSDTWDGYRESRRRLLDHVADAPIGGVVFLTGDYHSSWAFEVPPPLGSDDAYDPVTGAGARAVELVTPAVSSRPPGKSLRAREVFAGAMDRHPHLKFLDFEHNGYLIVDLTRERVRAQWMFTGDSAHRSAHESPGPLFESPPSPPHLRRIA